MRRVMPFLYIASSLLALFLASPLRSDFLGWLDGPAYRSNPNDPLSPWHRPSPSAMPTISASPTLGDSPTASPSVTATFTDSPTSTPSDTASPSPTFSESPTFTLTPFVLYDGDGAGSQYTNGSRVTYVVTPGGVPGGSTILTNVESAGGPSGSGNAIRIEMRCLNAPILAGPRIGGAGSADVSAYDSLSLWIKSEDGSFNASIMIRSPGGTVATNTSAAVTATAYTVDYGNLDAGVWRHVVIPLTAFDGVNYWGQSYSLAANANLIESVVVMPTWPLNYYYYALGPYYVFRNAPAFNFYYSALWVDNVHFQAAGSLPATGRYPAIFDTFQSPDAWTQWGTQWSVFQDSWTCGAVNTAVTSPDGVPSVWDGFFPGPLNGTSVGHIAGTLGDAAGAGVGSCTTEFSYAGMEAPLSAGGGPVNLDTLPGMPLTAGRVTGLRVTFKRLTSSAAVDYDLIVRKASVAALNDGAHYRHVFTAAQLPVDTWQTFDIPFPTVGLPGTDTANSFGQPAWAAGAGATVNWDASDLLSMQIAPNDNARGLFFDLLVGQIKFY